VKIRKAEFKDAEQIANVKIRSWQGSFENVMPQGVIYSLSLDELTLEWQETLTNARNTMLCEVNNEIVGFISYGSHRTNFEENLGEIYALYFLPDYRSNGYGSKLIAYALDELKNKGFKEVYLWVLSKNSVAIEFYKKHGFCSTNKQKIYEIVGYKLPSIAYYKRFNSNKK
jgi:ribosomal protein S18 acetylase RimI-like enzyme